MALQTWSKCLLASIFSAIVAGSGAAQSVDDAAVLKDFQERVTNYLSIQKENGVNSKPSNSAKKLEERKQEAQEKMRESRPAAKQGNIFTPQIGAYFKKQIAATMRGTDGPKVQASLRRAEPLPKVRLSVNEKYPRTLPLQSTPPSLLLNLPRLPDKLQYRIVGSTLVLYDLTSDLIVDLLPEAIPAS
jgi:hypothetical protein